MAVLFLYVADENNPSQLHFGKKCLKGEQGIVYSHIWVTKPNQPLPVSEDQCPPELDESHAEHEPVLKPNRNTLTPKADEKKLPLFLIKNF
jgi:hypothetical protein